LSSARAGPNVAAANVIAIAARPAAKSHRRLRAEPDDVTAEAITPLRGALLMRIVHSLPWIFKSYEIALSGAMRYYCGISEAINEPKV
jgi:hypothetical protein